MELGFVAGAIQNFAGVFKNPVWEFRGLVDTDGDGDTDVYLRNGTTNAWRAFEIDNMATVGRAFNPGLLQNPDWVLQHFGDYDADGDEDALIRNSQTGSWRIAEIENRMVQSFTNPGLPNGLSLELQK